MDNESIVNGISTTELLIILGCGLMWMNWIVGIAFIAVPIALLEWQEKSKEGSLASQHQGERYITSIDMVAAT